MEMVVRALAELAGRKGGTRAVVMTAERKAGGGYRERLEVDVQSRVVGIRRRFVRGEQQVGAVAGGGMED